MIEGVNRLEDNIARVRTEKLLEITAQLILVWITTETIDNQLQAIISKGIKPEIYEWYKIYDLWQPFDLHEFTYFEIQDTNENMQTHHHDAQNAVVAVLEWEWEAYIWWLRWIIQKWSIMYLPAWISHGIKASRSSVLKLISIQDTPILNADGTRDFHIDEWQMVFWNQQNPNNYFLI